MMPTQDPSFLSEDASLELRNVNVARGDRVVLHDIDLTVRAGEHVVILGPNGCGKSTLILTMTCQIYPLVLRRDHRPRRRHRRLLLCFHALA